MDTLALFFGIFSVLVSVPTMTEGITEENNTYEVTIPVYRVTTVLNEPWIMKSEDGYEGFLVDMLNEIATWSNFSYVIKETPNNTHGRIKYMPGEIQVNGIIGEIISGAADLAVADLIISSETSNVVTFSTPFANTWAQILLRKPENNSRGLGVLLAPFSLSLWMCTLVAVLFATLTVYFTARFQHTADEYEMETIRQSLVRSVQFILSAFLLRSQRDTRTGFPMCIISLSWWCFVVVTLIAYTASLTAYLLSNSNTKPIIPFKTFEEMTKQSDVRYGGWYEMSLNENDHVQGAMKRHISSEHTQYSNIGEAIERVLDKENEFAAVVDGLNGQKAVNENCELMLLREQLFEIRYGIACSHDVAGEALCLDISVAITALREDGTLYRIMTKWWENSGRCDKAFENDFITSSRAGITYFRSLEVKDLFVAYAVLLSGIVLCVTSTVISRRCFKKPKNKREGRQAHLNVSNGHQEQRKLNTLSEQDRNELSLEEAPVDNPDVDAF